ncbi:MAG: hypothetical protein JSR39_03965 [Verrucomicrobia bacterium]|nr:hypothetical protein [Verrucomicrobiota bacterium]
MSVNTIQQDPVLSAISFRMPEKGGSQSIKDLSREPLHESVQWELNNIANGYSLDDVSKYVSQQISALSKKDIKGSKGQYLVKVLDYAIKQKNKFYETGWGIVCKFFSGFGSNNPIARATQIRDSINAKDNS